MLDLILCGGNEKSRTQNVSFLNHFPKQQILDSSKVKDYADGNFKFDENGRKFSQRIENTVRKGEIAHH